jgi:oxygen-independent coproporphyrinogen-3 oxidase
MKMEMHELELYLHIPFCARKCRYCDFLSAPADRYTIEAYLRALENELQIRSKEYSDYMIVSIFIGGGTPSLLPAKAIVSLMDVIRENYQLSTLSIPEITIEANPDSLTAEKASAYLAAGINRLSIGLQSANDAELERLGRIHTFSQFLTAYQAARAAGFTNINVDLMSALPGQTREDYLQTLSAVLSLTPPPEHISAYSLIVEEQTPFWEMYQKGELKLPTEDLDRQMYYDTKHILQQNGYHRYEISNYAKPGYECRHNCGYWIRRNYAGFGLGAASLIDNTRFSNSTYLQEYIEYWGNAESDSVQNKPLLTIDHGISNHPQTSSAPFLNKQSLTVKEQMEEFMFLGLRLTQGISPDAFFDQFGVPIETIYGQVIQSNINSGLLTKSIADLGCSVAITLSTKDRSPSIRLTEKGLDLSNYVMSQFLIDSC